MGLPEKPKPGSDIATTWKASAAVPPCAAGSVSGPMIFVNSAIEPGQPCVTASASAFGLLERWWMKWTVRPSMVVVNWLNWLSRRSAARQS